MLTPTTATSDVQGFIQTVVSAGSVATSVRVTATVTSVTPVIATQSDQLTITTGIPDNDSVSLSTACVNVEGWNIDGITSQTTIRMADRYNNPVPDGTAVTFTSEGGQIGGSCQTATFPTEAGVCSVSWVTQAPRPPNGRVSILATAIGEETFTDVDSNGRFNGTDFEAPIGEPYRDDNENTVYDVNEVFSDFNSNGVRDDEVQTDYLGFNGLLCDVATGNCNPNETLFVSDDIVIVMSSSNASIFDNVGGAITGSHVTKQSVEAQVTQAPRPPNGRVSILATAIGEETFTDVDSNGRFNGTDFEAPIGEPYRDDNENTVYDVNEVFSDFNSNGVRDDEVQTDYLGFNGLLCDVATGNCNPNETLFVSDDIVIVMSSSNASIFDNVGGAITVPPASGAAVTFTLTIGDNKGNGTTIQLNG